MANIDALLATVREGAFESDFEASDDQSGLAPWFLDREDLAKDFHAIGSDGTGGIVALWTRGAPPTEEHPVVLLDSEGARVGLARNLAGFVALLEKGVRPLSRPKQWSDAAAARVAEEVGAPFEDWAKSVLGF